MGKIVRDGLFGIAFWQIFLTPYLLFWLHLGMNGYGKWCLANILLSFLSGPLYIRIYTWAMSHGS